MPVEENTPTLQETDPDPGRDDEEGIPKGVDYAGTDSALPESQVITPDAHGSNDAGMSRDAIRQLARQFIDDQAAVANDDEVEEELVQEGDEEPTRFTYSTKSKGRPYSKVWNFFQKVDSEKNAPAVCKLCMRDGVKSVVKRAGASTRDMWSHMRKYHGIDQYGKAAPQGTKAEDVPPFQPQSQEMKALNWAIARWIVINKRPFNIVASEEFQHMFKVANPRIRLASRGTYRRLADKLMGHTVAAVKEHLEPIWRFGPSYTADMWSALDQTQYLGVQLHAYDKDWNYVLVSTGAVVLPPPHTAARVASGIDDQLLKFGFTGEYKISATTDSGANIHAAVEDHLYHDWLPCFNHMMHNAVHDVLRLPEIASATNRAHDVCAMIRKSPAKWEQLKQVQQDLIKQSDLQEEDDDDVDDLGEGEMEVFTSKKDKVLRPKVGQKTRWNSVAAMLQRLVLLKVSFDTWFAIYSSQLKPDDPQKLSDEDWVHIMDVVDVLGLIVPLTKALEQGADPGIAHVFPQLLALLTRQMVKVPDSAQYYSGRTKAAIASMLGVGANAPSEQCISPLQKQIIAELTRAFFGEKGEGGRQPGRCNSFMVIYAWGITAGMDPRNLARWDKRISEPLDQLLQRGYGLKAYKETRAAYLTDIVGVQGDGADALAAVPEVQPADAGTTGGEGASNGGRGGTDAVCSTPPDGKRKRKPSSRYLSSPQQGPVRKKATGRPRKQPRQDQEPSFGGMLKMLVLDEIGRMGKEMLHMMEGGQEGEGGPPGGDGSNNGKDIKAFKGPKKLGMYSDDEEEVVVAKTVDAVEQEVSRYQLEENEEKLDVLDWWKLNEVRYPILAMVARRNLAVQATSSEAERDFSAAGLVTSKQRLSLTPDSVNICTFCSINKKFVPMQEPQSNCK